MKKNPWVLQHIVDDVHIGIRPLDDMMPECQPLSHPNPICSGQHVLFPSEFTEVAVHSNSSASNNDICVFPSGSVPLNSSIANIPVSTSVPISVGSLECHNCDLEGA